MQPLAATTLIGLGSAFTLAASVLATKTYAMLVGPEGVGHYALLLSVLNMGLLLFGLGLQAATTRLIAERRARSDLRGARAVATAAIFVAAVSAAAGAVVLAALAEPIATLALGNESRANDVRYLAPALALTAVANTGVGILSGFQQVRASTATAILSALVGATAGVLVVMVLGTRGFAPALVVAGAAQFLLVATALRRARILTRIAQLGTMTAPLLSLGLPFMLSQVVTTGSVLAIPVLVLQLAGSAEVGYYRAAAAISLGLGVVFVTALHQDFMPRVAATRAGPERLAVVEERMQIVVGLGLPIILVLFALAPLTIEVLYTTDFAPAAAVLEWQLLGDAVRLPVLVLMTTAMAAGRRSTYVGLELLGGVALLAASLGAIQLLGVAGAGLGYATAQIVTYCAAWVALRGVGVVPSPLQAVVVAVPVGGSLLISLGIDPLIRSGMALLVAMLVSATAAMRFRSVHRGSA